MKRVSANDNEAVHAGLLDQQHALGTYLGSLLQEQCCEADACNSPLQDEVVPVVLPLTEQNPSDRALTRFEAQLFSVAGITLAVPLSRLSGVIDAEQPLAPVSGDSPMFIGTVSCNGVQSRVLDTARLVLPADRAAALDPVTGERAASLVLIDEGRWALACKQIGDVVELDSSDIKWRSDSSKRLWLAGTVRDRACALLDVEQLVLLLNEEMARNMQILHPE